MAKEFQNFRSMFDLTPWDVKGNSAFGLKRHEAKFLAMIFIIAGAILVNPPFIPSPDDFLNFILAGFLFNHLDMFTYNTWLILTFTIIPWSLIIIGVWIYPYNTKSLLNGYINKAKRFIKKILQSPQRIIISIVVFSIIYHLYAVYLI